MWLIVAVSCMTTHLGKKQSCCDIFRNISGRTGKFGENILWLQGLCLSV
jgi:hypothetical protein